METGMGDQQATNWSFSGKQERPVAHAPAPPCECIPLPLQRRRVGCSDGRSRWGGQLVATCVVHVRTGWRMGVEWSLEVGGGRP